MDYDELAIELRHHEWHGAAGAIEQLQAEIERLEEGQFLWTDELPNVPGWYWWREQNAAARCYHVLPQRDGKPYLPVWSTTKTAQWSGPIPKPLEPSDDTRRPHHRRNQTRPR